MEVYDNHQIKTENRNDSRVCGIAQIKAFAKVSGDIEFQGSSRKEKYAWIEEVVRRFGYFSLKKKEKTIVKGYYPSPHKLDSMVR